MGLDSVELLMAVEETFQISISEKEASEIFTVGDFYNVILQKLDQRSSQAGKLWNNEEVWKVLRSVIIHQLGVKPEEVTKEARIVQDLGAD